MKIYPRLCLPLFILFLGCKSDFQDPNDFVLDQFDLSSFPVEGFIPDIEQRKDQGLDYVIVINTEFGPMMGILYEETPLHKANFLKLVNEGFYDSLIFHRVIKDFMIQGGDPDSKNTQPGTSLGSGGPGYTIPAEFNTRLFHKKGALSAARLGDDINPRRASSGSQFYVVQGQTSSQDQLTTDVNKLISAAGQYLQQTGDTALMNQLFELYRTNPQDYVNKLVSLKDEIAQTLNTDFVKPYPPERLEAYTTVGGAPHLDDTYTVFGQIVEGLEVVDMIAGQETGKGDRPVADVMMLVSMHPVPRSKITEKYGYRYPSGN